MSSCSLLRLLSCPSGAILPLWFRPTLAVMAAESNGLIRFTNCLLPREDWTLVNQDLWIDEKRGVILDPLVRGLYSQILIQKLRSLDAENLLRTKTEP